MRIVPRLCHSCFRLTASNYFRLLALRITQTGSEDEDSSSDDDSEDDDEEEDSFDDDDEDEEEEETEEEENESDADDEGFDEELGLIRNEFANMV